MSTTPSLAQRFTDLATQWSQETGYHSNMTKRAMHPAYQQIIGMGPAVVPLILDEFRRGSVEDWFWALTAITGENPITEAIAGHVPRMADAWIAWGEAHGVFSDPPVLQCPTPAIDTQGQVICVKLEALREGVEYLKTQVAHLEDDVGMTNRRNGELMDAEDGYRLEIANLSIINQDLRTPCTCDPPGSGPTCNGVCLIRAVLADHVANSGPDAYDTFLRAFDLAVTDVRRAVHPTEGI